jgi:hypothetical protein
MVGCKYKSLKNNYHAMWSKVCIQTFGKICFENIIKNGKKTLHI